MKPHVYIVSFNERKYSFGPSMFGRSESDQYVWTVAWTTQYYSKLRDDQDFHKVQIWTVYLYIRFNVERGENSLGMDQNVTRETTLLTGTSAYQSV